MNKHFCDFWPKPCQGSKFVGRTPSPRNRPTPPLPPPPSFTGRFSEYFCCETYRYPALYGLSSMIDPGALTDYGVGILYQSWLGEFEATLTLYVYYFDE